MRTRRLLLLAALSLAPFAAACTTSLTGPAEPTAKAASETMKAGNREQNPWH